MHEETDVLFIPDSSLLLTGTSVKRGSGASGTIEVFDTCTLSAKETVPVAVNCSVVSLAWHPALRQLFAGLSDGTVQIYYDRFISKKGILLPMDRIPTTSGAFIGESVGIIRTPNALPLFRSEMESKSLKRQRIKARQDPIASRRPDLPMEGHGVGGRIGSSVTQSIMKNLIKDTSRDEDPREALLKYAEVAEKDPRFITPAYQDTQPKPILDQELLKKEAEQEAKRRKAEEEAAKFTAKFNNKLSDN